MRSVTELADIRPADLPSPPRHAISIVHTCSRPNITSRKLAEIVTHDPVLTAELLRVVNSAFFGFRTKISSAARAVTVIGHRALRNLALCIAMRDALRSDAILGFDINQYWETGLRRAVSAHKLGAEIGLDADECFTIGLLQDFGLLVLLYLHQDKVHEWERLVQASPDERQELEYALFHATHDQVGVQLAESWDLPAEMIQVIGQHHASLRQGLSEEDERLADVALCADWMASVFSAQDKRLTIPRCQAIIEERLGVGADRAIELLDEVAEGVEAAAEALNLKVQSQVSFEEVLRQANLQLAQDNLTYQELTWRLENALRERDRYASELNRELELAREVQRSLLPRDGRACPGFHGMNVSAKEVSGDFFDFLRLPDGRIYFCIADVSGKGMNAALLMAKTASLFHCLGKGIADPGALATMLNREICETSVRGMFVTMVLGVYEAENHRVRLVNAGHLPVLHLGTAGSMQRYEATAPPLGIVPGLQYSASEFGLGTGTLYLFTDGLTEARRADGTEIGIDGLLTIIRRNRELPPGERVRRIIEQVQRASATVADDLTLVVLEPAPGSDDD